MTALGGAQFCMQISLSETLVWRAAEMVQRLDLASLAAATEEQPTEAATDVPMQMSLVSISNLSGKVRCGCMLRSRKCPTKLSLC